MPDKRTDEQFMDQAWEQMQIVLDREMPEERKRRLMPIFWMLGAAASLLLLLTVGVIWWQQQIHSPISSIEKINLTAPAVLADEDCEAVPNTVLPRHLRSKAKPLDRYQLVSAEKNHLDISNSSKDFANQVKEKTQQINSTEFTLVESYSKNTNNQSLINIEPLRKTSIAALNYQTPNTFDNKPRKPNFWYPLDPAESNSPTSQKSDAVKIGVEFATYSSVYAAIDGYAGGAVLDIPVKNNHWNLRAGINYNAQQRYFNTEGTNQTNRTADPNNPAFGAANVVVDPNPELSLNAQQISMPVTLQFKPRRTWGLEGGLQAAYLLSAQNLKGAEAYQTLTGLTYGNEKIRTLVSSLTQDTANKFAPGTSNSDKINLDELRRFDLAVSAGFGYYPTQTIGVRLQYQRGLIDLLKANDFKAFGNNLRLSAVYFFGK